MATEPVWVVILKIEGGTFETGFPCQLLVSPQDRPRETFTGRLPSSLELRDCYDRWKGLYDGLGQANLITLPPQTIVVSHFDECEQAAQQLKRALNAWLNSESFRNIERQWLQTMPSRVRQLHFFVQTDEPCLKRLPWQVWDLLEQHYPDTEVMLSTEYQPSQVVLRSPLRILAVEGNTTGTSAKLNLGPLTTHPNLHIETLRQPAKKVFEDSLWDESWDILFFMGHSRSHEFEPNSDEKISVNDRHHALENAVKNGLKLAIFNSCDGVDIAAKFADLKIPYTIVMRHPIPDKMAELFLETFLKQFAQGKSIHESVHTARRRLKDQHSSFPCADWLPVIYQNPGAPDMRYVQPRARSPWLTRWVALLLLACLGLVLAFSFHDRQIQAEYDRRTSKGEKILWRENMSQPAKNQAVQAFAAGQYAEAIEKFQLSLKDSGEQDPEAIIYLNNAKQRQAFARGQRQPADRIAVSVPFSSSNTNIALEMLQGIAQAQSNMTNATPIEVMIVDDENKGEVIEKIGPKLAADPTILAVVGPNASDVAVRAAKIYGQNQLTMITPTAFSTELEGLGNYVYRMPPKVETMVQSLGIYLSRKDKAAVCYDRDSPDNRVFQQGFRNALNEMKIEVTKIECFLEEGKASAIVASRLVNDKVTVLLLAPHISNIERAFPIAEAVRGKGIRLLGSTTFYTRKTIEKGGSKVAGLIIPVPWIPQADRRDIFSQQWQANVTWRTAMSYDALNVVGEALAKRGHSRQDLRLALQQDSFAPGITGGNQPIKFDQGHRQISTGLITVKVQKNAKGDYEFKPLETIKTKPF